MEDIILEIIKFTIPALVVFFTSFLLLKSYLNNDFKKRIIEFRKSNQKTTLPLRLQAYERMALFLERISLNNLIHRTYKSNMNISEFHQTLINSIRLEYEHNQSQQIYISSQKWELIITVKEEVISLINRLSSEIPPNTSGKRLSKSILETLLKSKHISPTQKALNALKSEAKELF